jgi:hypothetical protein
LSEIKAKLSALQTNKAALEEKMEDFERRLSHPQVSSPRYENLRQN